MPAIIVEPIVSYAPLYKDEDAYEEGIPPETKVLPLQSYSRSPPLITVSTLNCWTGVAVKNLNQILTQSGSRITSAEFNFRN